MTTSAKNRNQSYLALQKDMSRRQAQVYLAIKKLGKATCKQVCTETRLPINTVVARVNELYTDDLLSQVGSVINQRTMRPCTVYEVNLSPDRRRSYRRSIEYRKAMTAKKIIQFFKDIERVGNKGKVLEHEVFEQLLKLL